MVGINKINFISTEAKIGESVGSVVEKNDKRRTLKWNTRSEELYYLKSKEHQICFVRL